ncbi:hypothetical protein EVAR_33011_1 [Eumeta japonica]|uniref:Uncharacterized protein n=1 Tax=Eumeta variegata TaxID=151549 RepID=A0A4C1VTX7_EUMVA|nr:hypothetical protein EVAR_33011_1 [Eumeta japonica]
MQRNFILFDPREGVDAKLMIYAYLDAEPINYGFGGHQLNRGRVISMQTTATYANTTCRAPYPTLGPLAAAGARRRRPPARRVHTHRAKRERVFHDGNANSFMLKWREQVEAVRYTCLLPIFKMLRRHIATGIEIEVRGRSKLFECSELHMPRRTRHRRGRRALCKDLGLVDIGSRLIFALSAEPAIGQLGPRALSARASAGRGLYANNHVTRRFDVRPYARSGWCSLNKRTRSIRPCSDSNEVSANSSIKIKLRLFLEDSVVFSEFLLLRSVTGSNVPVGPWFEVVFLILPSFGSPLQAEVRRGMRAADDRFDPISTRSQIGLKV